MNVRPKFLRWVGIFFVSGLLVDAVVYFHPHINLPQPSRAYCPILAWLRPLSKAPVQSTDSLELVTFVGKPLVPYIIRIYGDGRVERDTVLTLPSKYSIGCPLHDPDKHLRLPVPEATALIAKARDGGFCRLCMLYQATHPSSNDSFVRLSLTFRGKTNQVNDSSGNPPPLFSELVNAFDVVPSIPDYAKFEDSSQQRKAECREFFESQFDDLRKRLAQH